MNEVIHLLVSPCCALDDFHLSRNGRSLVFIPARAWICFQIGRNVYLAMQAGYLASAMTLRFYIHSESSSSI